MGFESYERFAYVFPEGKEKQKQVFVNSSKPYGAHKGGTSIVW